ncbi:hypothetical protein [Streptomyces sp. NPDC048106]|uniref:hypothetical protein n=1 Tax=Streptomyces sp. NPDC048106 TaxID=3155750 RepID=UPI003453DBCB
MLASANVMMATASAPSPIFAVYVVGLLGALSTVGSLSAGHEYRHGHRRGSGGAAGSVDLTPRSYLFPVLTLTFVVLAAVVLTIPGTLVPRAMGLASLRPRGRGPREVRPFLALTPSLVSNVLHVRSGAAGGLSIAALFLSNSVGGLWSVRHTARLAALLGAVLLTLGASGLAVAIAVALPAVYVGGSVVAGLGVCLTFSGNLRSISAVTTANDTVQITDGLITAYRRVLNPDKPVRG